MAKPPQRLFTPNNMPDALNEKNRWEVEYYWNRIQNDQFDWEGISALLIALRPGMGKQGTSGLRDLADFVAHPMRDRGLIFEHIEKQKPSIVRGVIRIGVLPLEPLVHTLAQLLIHHKIAASAEVVNALKPRDLPIRACLLSLLHFGEVKLGQQRAILKIGSTAGVLWLNVELPNGEQYPRLSTGLRTAHWVGCNPGELHTSVNIRAVRGSDGLKLRKV